MSLLEDIFLEDEAGEAQDLERVIEGDEFEERRRSDDDSEDNNSVRGSDEAEEDKRRVDPQPPKHAKVVKNPRFVLNPARLTGPRGIHVIPEHFRDFKFIGKGHEKEDLDLVLKKLEHWTYRLYPKFKFADCLKKIEHLGKKRPVMVHLQKIRSDQFQSEETVVQRDSSDDEAPQPEEDEFDKLLQQQIDIARTPVQKTVQQTDIGPTKSAEGPLKTLGVGMPPGVSKTTSSPSLSEEQKERMIRNRRMAEEKRLARLKQNSDTNGTTSVDLTGVDIGNKDFTVSKTLINDNVNLKENPDIVTQPKTLVTTSGDAIPLNTVHLTEHEEIDSDNNVTNVSDKNSTHRRNVIDSSSEDEDCNMLATNTSITVDVHNNYSRKYSNMAVSNGTCDMGSSDDDQGLRIDESVTVDNKSVANEAANNHDDYTIKKDDNKHSMITKETNPEAVFKEDKLMEIQSGPTIESNVIIEVREKGKSDDGEVMDIDFGND